MKSDSNSRNKSPTFIFLFVGFIMLISNILNDTGSTIEPHYITHLNEISKTKDEHRVDRLCLVCPSEINSGHLLGISLSHNSLYLNELFQKPFLGKKEYFSYKNIIYFIITKTNDHFLLFNHYTFRGFLKQLIDKIFY